MVLSRKDFGLGNINCNLQMEAYAGAHFYSRTSAQPAQNAFFTSIMFEVVYL